MCEAILRGLPAWFGIESSLQAYVREVEDLELSWAAHDTDDKIVGFLSVKLHYPWTAELHVMGVEEDWHRKGVGRALVATAEAELAARGVELFFVKTLGPSREDEAYARTRRFYEALGFRPLEELHGLWGPGNPTLVLVKTLRARAAST